MGQFALRDAIKRGFLLPRINELGSRIYSQFLKWVLRGSINFLDAPESRNWIIAIVNSQIARENKPPHPRASLLLKPAKDARTQERPSRSRTRTA